MEKQGLVQAVMIWGAGASMLHVAKNFKITIVGNQKKEITAARKSNLSDTIETITKWTVRSVMSLILISCGYQLLFSGNETGRIVYCLGIAISFVYFMISNMSAKSKLSSVVTSKISDTALVLK